MFSKEIHLKSKRNFKSKNVFFPEATTTLNMNYTIFPCWATSKCETNKKKVQNGQKAAVH